MPKKKKNKLNLLIKVIECTEITDLILKSLDEWNQLLIYYLHYETDDNILIEKKLIELLEGIINNTQKLKVLGLIDLFFVDQTWILELEMFIICLNQ
jgi:hypothetical protein